MKANVSPMTMAGAKARLEEIEHAEKLISYVLKRGGNVNTPSVSVSILT